MTETRTVKLWLGNDEGLYDHARELAREADDVYALAQSLRDWIADDMAPELDASLYSDLLTHALQGVDWQEVAGDFWEEREPISETDERGVVEVLDVDAYEREHPEADVATCGTCDRSWDDAVSTAWTPAPSGRCPFEYDHEEVS